MGVSDTGCPRIGNGVLRTAISPTRQATANGPQYGITQELGLGYSRVDRNHGACEGKHNYAHSQHLLPSQVEILLIVCRGLHSLASAVVPARSFLTATFASPNVGQDSSQTGISTCGANYKMCYKWLNHIWHRRAVHTVVRMVVKWYFLKIVPCIYLYSFDT
jgi:hypothetical protein